MTATISESTGRDGAGFCRVVRNRKKTEYGLGSVDTTSLILARKKRDALLEQLRNGVDPKEEGARRARPAPRSSNTLSARRPIW